VHILNFSICDTNKIDIGSCCSSKIGKDGARQVLIETPTQFKCCSINDIKTVFIYTRRLYPRFEYADVSVLKTIIGEHSLNYSYTRHGVYNMVEELLGHNGYAFSEPLYSPIDTTYVKPVGCTVEIRVVSYTGREDDIIQAIKDVSWFIFSNALKITYFLWFYVMEIAYAMIAVGIVLLIYQSCINFKLIKHILRMKRLLPRTGISYYASRYKNEIARDKITFTDYFIWYALNCARRKKELQINHFQLAVKSLISCGMIKIIKGDVDAFIDDCRRASVDEDFINIINKSDIDVENLRNYRTYNLRELDFFLPPNVYKAVSFFQIFGPPSFRITPCTTHICPLMDTIPILRMYT
jgi:hypothetical protein